MRIFTLLSFAAIFAAQSANAQNPVQNQRISLESTSGVYAPAQSPGRNDSSPMRLIGV